MRFLKEKEIKNKKSGFYGGTFSKLSFQKKNLCEEDLKTREMLL